MAGGNDDCSVILTNGQTCYCDQVCHMFGECCYDILQIGCHSYGKLAIIYIDVLVS